MIHDSCIKRDLKVLYFKKNLNEKIIERSSIDRASEVLQPD